jgi:hypothetical protein
MYVIKRNGAHEPVAFDKISARIEKLCYGLDRSYIDVGVIAQKVVAGVHTGVRTAQLDDLACETAAYMTTQHPDYGKLAARLAISNLHKSTEPSFAATVGLLHSYVDPLTNESAPLVSDETLAIAREHAATLDGAIKHERDFEYDFFGFRTLERSYLLQMAGKVVERPQHMLMRVAIGARRRRRAVCGRGSGGASGECANMDVSRSVRAAPGASALAAAVPPRVARARRGRGRERACVRAYAPRGVPHGVGDGRSRRLPR